MIDYEAVKRVMEQGGRLSEYELLLLRERYFSDGCVLGSAEFVAEQIPLLRKLGTTTRKGEKTFPVPAGKTAALRAFRQLR